MQAVDDAKLAQLLLEGLRLFPVRSTPAAPALLEGDQRDCGEITNFLAGRKWNEIACSAELRAAPDEDLAEIFARLSRIGLCYYLPGFLMHFLRVGTYSSNLTGPNFFYHFCTRLQCDSPRVSAYGGCEAYFALNDDQLVWCGDLMWNIYLRYGDPYERYVDQGYEHLDLAQHSLARALTQYWKQDW